MVTHIYQMVNTSGSHRDARSVPLRGVLSGTAADGGAGVRRLREHGSIPIAQLPSGADPFRGTQHARETPRPVRIRN
jgi:hypothetical protein